MVDLLARELRIPSSDLKEYLDEHVEPGLMRSLGANALAEVKKGVVEMVTGAGEKGEEEGEDEGEEEEEEKKEGGGGEGGGKEEGVARDSLQRNFLNHYDELDRLRTLVIPPLEDMVRELRRQVMERDVGLAEAKREIEMLKQQLVRATAGLPTP